MIAFPKPNDIWHDGVPPGTFYRVPSPTPHMASHPSTTSRVHSYRLLDGSPTMEGERGTTYRGTCGYGREEALVEEKGMKILRFRQEVDCVGPTRRQLVNSPLQPTRPLVPSREVCHSCHYSRGAMKTRRPIIRTSFRYGTHVDLLLGLYGCILSWFPGQQFHGHSPFWLDI